MVTRHLRWHELSDKQKLQVVEKIFKDSNFDLSRLSFQVEIRDENELTFEELEELIKDCVKDEDYRKAERLRVFVESKKKLMN